MFRSPVDVVFGRRWDIGGLARVTQRRFLLHDEHTSGRVPGVLAASAPPYDRASERVPIQNGAVEPGDGRPGRVRPQAERAADAAERLAVVHVESVELDPKGTEKVGERPRDRA